MKEYRVGIIGATGMVGQRFLELLENHPWFKVTILAASSKSKGKTYYEAAKDRFSTTFSVPKKYYDMIVYDATNDIDIIKKEVDFVFCAVDMKKDEVIKLEELYILNEIPVVSNNSANRYTLDVPMIIPEINLEHLKIIDAQKRRYNTKRGFVAVKSNCSLQSYLPPLNYLRPYGLKEVVVTTYQAISGAGKTFETWPEMLDNVIPYISGEEEKSETEPKKIWGAIKDNQIVLNSDVFITSQCIRVPVSDGHLACVFFKLDKKTTKEEIIDIWKNTKTDISDLNLPSAPKNFLTYFDEEFYPQTKIHRDIENGMGISIGRLRQDFIYDYKFVCLSHNTIRGAAGGAILLAEALCAKEYI